MNKLLLCIVGSAALLGAAACSESPADNTTIAFETIGGSAAYRLDGSGRDYDCDSDLVYYDTACIVMPTVIFNQDITALQDSILQAAFDTVAVDHLEAMKTYFRATASEAGYPVVETDHGDKERDSSDGLTAVTGNVFSLSPELLTYRVNHYVLPPHSANGISTNRYITYSIPQGKILNLQDLFTPEGLEKLPAEIAARARALRSLLGPTNVTELPASGNFYIDLDGSIAFVYEPSEVASFAQGEICVPFYPYQLTEYMTATALKLFGLNEE